MHYRIAILHQRLVDIFLGYILHHVLLPIHVLKVDGRCINKCYTWLRNTKEVMSGGISGQTTSSRPTTCQTEASVSYSSMGGQVQIRFRSPYGLLIRLTGGQYFTSRK